MIIPGSHRKYLACVGETPEDHYRSSLKKQEYGVPDEDSLAELAAEHGIVAPTCNAGTAIIFDCNAMHGSNGNITPFPRANAFIVYNAVSNRLVARTEEHTSELQSLMRISYAVFCLKKKNKHD